MSNRPSDKELAPIERDESYDRTYIPLPGGWEIQTKGKGSTFRLLGPDGFRLPIIEQPYLFEHLERMARDIHAACARSLDAAPSEPSAEHWRAALYEAGEFQEWITTQQAEWIEQRAREIAREGK